MATHAQCYTRARNKMAVPGVFSQFPPPPPPEGEAEGYLLGDTLLNDEGGGGIN
jgi:hypothetical protein